MAEMGAKLNVGFRAISQPLLSTDLGRTILSFKVCFGETGRAV
jgi:hypothetical protein